MLKTQLELGARRLRVHEDAEGSDFSRSRAPHPSRSIQKADSATETLFLMLRLLPLCMSAALRSGSVSAQTRLRSGHSRLILASRMRCVSDFALLFGDDCSETFPHYMQSVFLLVGNLFTALLMSLERKEEACSLTHDISVGLHNQTHPSPPQMTLS